MGHTCNDVIVKEVIEVIVVFADVEETVTFQTERLMYLEVETNCFHILFQVVVV